MKKILIFTKFLHALKNRSCTFLRFFFEYTRWPEKTEKLEFGVKKTQKVRRPKKPEILVFFFRAELWQASPQSSA